METNIKTLREARNLTLPALAELAGMNKGKLSYIERGIQHPTNAEVEALAEALGAPIEMWYPVNPR